jgi:hypothetical protein
MKKRFSLPILIFSGMVVVALACTVFAPHLAGLAGGSLPRLVSLPEFAGRLVTYSAALVLLLLARAVLIVLARYWFGEEMILAGARVMLRLIEPARLWQLVRPVFVQLTSLFFEPKPTLPTFGRHLSGIPPTSLVVIVKTARPFLLFQAAPLRIP